VKATLSLLLLTALAYAGDLRLGIVGTDGHGVHFAKLLNNPASPDHVPGARVVAAFRGGSPDLKDSTDRLDKYTEELRSKWNVEMVADIPTLCGQVDGVLLESIDGRVHLEQARQVIAAGKPLFIDKPLAATLEDAREIARLARIAGVPWFSSSALRYAKPIAAMRSIDITGVTVWGPGPLEQHHPLDLSWYAIHPIEILYTLMGVGCEEVTRVSAGDSDVIVGRWKDGRLGTVRALRPYGPYGAVVFRPTGASVTPPNVFTGFRPLVEEIVRFFQTHAPPVANEETMEVFAFLDAAQRSKETGGQPQRLLSDFRNRIGPGDRAVRR